MSRYCHDSTCAITGKYVFGYVNGALLAGNGINAIGAREYTSNGVVNHTLALGTTLDVCKVFLHGLLLLLSGQLSHQFALGSKNEEGNTKHSIGTSGKDSELGIAISHLYLHLGTFASAYPVLLSLLDAIAPINGLKAVQQALSISTYAQTPLAHLLLLHGITTTHAHTLYYLVVGQYGT